MAGKKVVKCGKAIDCNIRQELAEMADAVARQKEKAGRKKERTD